MSDADEKRQRPRSPATVPISATRGNALFDRAVGAIGIDDGTSRWLLYSVLNMLGATPATLSPEELGHALPEVDRRLRQLVLAAQADAAMTRLYKTLMSWDGSG